MKTENNLINDEVETSTAKQTNKRNVTKNFLTELKRQKLEDL